jgi:hypothetical protein
MKHGEDETRGEENLGEQPFRDVDPCGQCGIQTWYCTLDGYGAEWVSGRITW